MANGDTKTNQYLDIAANGSRADLPADSCCDTRTQSLIRDVAERIMDVEDEVERLENNPDVVDIVATYADLQAYDTSTLTDKDIIRVLEDSTHNNNSTYYRWNANTNQFDFVGEISGGSSVNIVQTTGTSTTDVMSQDATTKLIYPNNNILRMSIGGIAPYNYCVGVGRSSVINGEESVAVGYATNASQYSTVVGRSATALGTAPAAVALGYNAQVAGNRGVAIGNSSKAAYENSVAIGTNSSTNAVGEVNIGAGTTGRGYNNTNYRLLSGVHDGQTANDAVTVGQVNSVIDNINSALNTNIPHIGATS